jgi:hypothetical protein
MIRLHERNTRPTERAFKFPRQLRKLDEVIKKTDQLLYQVTIV